MTAARYEPAVVPVDVRQRAEAVVLHFIDEIGMIERLRNAEQRRRRNDGEHRVQRNRGVQSDQGSAHRARMFHLWSGGDGEPSASISQVIGSSP